MEETFGSESSSGCESGWTLYLEHSDAGDKRDSFTHDQYDEEDDMSMVSDASSGPQQEDGCFKLNNNGGEGKRQQKIPKEEKKIHHLLDDTASSPLFTFSNNNLTKKAENEIVDYSQGYSTTYFQGKSGFEDHFGFFHPVQLQQNQWLQGKRWG